MITPNPILLVHMREREEKRKKKRRNKGRTKPYRQTSPFLLPSFPNPPTYPPTLPDPNRRIKQLGHRPLHRLLLLIHQRQVLPHLLHPRAPLLLLPPPSPTPRPTPTHPPTPSQTTRRPTPTHPPTPPQPRRRQAFHAALSPTHQPPTHPPPRTRRILSFLFLLLSSPTHPPTQPAAAAGAGGRILCAAHAVRYLSFV